MREQHPPPTPFLLWEFLFYPPPQLLEKTLGAINAVQGRKSGGESRYCSNVDLYLVTRQPDQPGGGRLLLLRRRWGKGVYGEEDCHDAPRGGKFNFSVRKLRSLKGSEFA